MRQGGRIVDVRNIPLESIRVSRFNTRKDLDDGAVDTDMGSLADSIREKGLLNPVTVRETSPGKYELVAGQRRFMACRSLGRDSIPAIVAAGMSDADAVVVSLIENVQRADMNPMDKARAYDQIMKSRGDHAAVAKETGVSVATIRRYLNMLDLAPALQERVTSADGTVGVGAMSSLAKSFEPGDQEDAYGQISGFKQAIQEQIIKKSGGDIKSIPELAEQAREGAFDVRTCREGLCFDMPDEMKAEVKRMLAGQGGGSMKDIAKRLR